MCMFDDLLLYIVVEVGKFNVFTANIMTGEAGDTIDNGAFDEDFVDVKAVDYLKDVFQAKVRSGDNS